MMIVILYVASFALMALAIPYMYRSVVGPTVFDRIIGLNGLGTKVPLLLILIGMIYGRADMFIDLALGLFLLNLFTTLLIGKYVREKNNKKVVE